MLSKITKSYVKNTATAFLVSQIAFLQSCRSRDASSSLQESNVAAENTVVLPGFLSEFKFSKDGKYIASVEEDRYSRNPKDSIIYLFDTHSRQQVWKKTIANIRSFEFVKGGSKIVVITNEIVLLLNTKTGTTEQEADLQSADYSAIAESPSGQTVYRSSGSSIKAIDLTNLKKSRIFDSICDRCEVRGLIASPDGKKLYSGDSDGTFHAWSTESGGLIASIDLSSWFLGRPDVSNDGRYLLFDTFASQVTLLDGSKNWTPQNLYGTDSAGGEDVSSGSTKICPSGEAIAVIDKKRLLIFDPSTGQQRLALPEENSPLVSLDVNSGGPCMFITRSLQGKVIVYSASGQEIARYNFDWLAKFKSGFTVNYYGTTGTFYTKHWDDSGADWGKIRLQFWRGPQH